MEMGMSKAAIYIYMTRKLRMPSGRCFHFAEIATIAEAKRANKILKTLKHEMACKKSKMKEFKGRKLRRERKKIIAANQEANVQMKEIQKHKYSDIAVRKKGAWIVKRELVADALKRVKEENERRIQNER